jgi:hypothetical protein
LVAGVASKRIKFSYSRVKYPKLAKRIKFSYELNKSLEYDFAFILCFGTLIVSNERARHSLNPSQFSALMGQGSSSSSSSSGPATNMFQNLQQQQQRQQQQKLDAAAATPIGSPGVTPMNIGTG